MAKRRDLDAPSGQVFEESSVRVAKTGSVDWIGEYRTPSLLKKGTHRNGQGARSLQGMARAQVARNMRGITADHLREVPWPVADNLWEEIISIHGESFHAWRVFAGSHGDSFNTLKNRYYIEMRRPPLPYPDYFRGLTSLSLDWLTCLRISPKYVDRADLVSIAKIANLAILDLSDNLATVETSPSRFDERIFRTWTELAMSEGAFKHLRIVLFGWQPLLSTWIFKYLNSFPALRLVVATACPDFGQWNRKDWEPLAASIHWEARHAKRSVQLMRPIINDENYYGAVSTMLYNTEIFGLKATKKPVVECWLGGPPAWENVVRDFPKVTQTVWLEKRKGVPDVLQPPRVLDQSKRLRETEIMLNGTRSPPPKRTAAQIRQKINKTTAADLLADLTGDE